MSCPWQKPSPASVAQSYAAVLLLATVLTACPPPETATDAHSDSDAHVADACSGSQTCTVLQPLSESAIADLQYALANARLQREYEIPAAWLSEHDVDSENDFFVALYDASSQHIGYLRDVFTSVSCLSGSCEAIHFALVFDTEPGFLDVFHPRNVEHDFMKYTPEGYGPFEQADRDRLREIVANPPATLVDVDNVADLVVDATSTAPTVAAQQDNVVRGAAFTTYVVLNYALDTPELINRVIAQEGQP